MTTSRPAKSREGWGVFVSGLCEEVEEDDVEEAFACHGTVTSLSLPLNRMTGNIKGYCMLEYSSREEATAAIKSMDGAKLRGQAIFVSWLVQDGPGILEEAATKASETCLKAPGPAVESCMHDRSSDRSRSPKAKSQS
mmetsp:Transcript_96978/g.172616  ORF Transcript_96978/g.172616 Transcript_96978/m.172616 type:complete len:138 (-) Transcript_96978:276-689(-)